METCLQCPKGMHTSEAGMAQCERCLPGFFADSAGRNACTPCDAGFFGGSHGLAACAPCPPGSYTAVRGEAECLLCPTGFFQDSAGQTSCVPCTEGYVAPFPGHSVCSACPPGSVFDRASKTCKRCPPNTFTAASAQTQCVRCPVGMAADGVGNVECFGKPEPGFERLASSSSRTNASQAECKPGFFNDGERLACEPCPPGTSAATHGALKCSPCARGSFAGSQGATTCELAPPGTFAAHEGAWKPRPCPPNSVSANAGSIGCTECPWPTFSLLSGGSRCESASAGEINDFVVWPRLTMTIAGVSFQDLDSKTASGGSSMDALGSSWKATLAAYGVKNAELHMLTVEPQTPDDDLLFVEFALETLPRPLPKRQKHNSTLFEQFRNKTAEFKRFIGATRASFEHAVGDGVETNRHASGNRSGDANESESSALQELVARPGFLESLVRQLHRQGVADVSASVVQLAVLADSPLRTSRALRCPNGTYFVQDTGVSDGDRDCRLCPMGTFSSAPGALQCSLCPAGTFADEEGLEECVQCPVGDGAYPGATACVTCYWFTYACEGFWEDVVVALVVGIWGGAKVWMRCHRALSGDTFLQQQSEQTALITAVRTNGRTGRSALYEPMVRGH